MNFKKGAKPWLYMFVVITSLVLEAFHADVTVSKSSVRLGIGCTFLCQSTIGSLLPALAKDNKVTVTKIIIGSYHGMWCKNFKI